MLPSLVGDSLAHFLRGDCLDHHRWCSFGVATSKPERIEERVFASSEVSTSKTPSHPRPPTTQPSRLTWPKHDGHDSVYQLTPPTVKPFLSLLPHPSSLRPLSPHRRQPITGQGIACLGKRASDFAADDRNCVRGSKRIP